MNKANEVMISRNGEQAFLSIAAMVAGKKETDPAMLIATIQNYKQMYDFVVANVERMESESKEG